MSERDEKEEKEEEKEEEKRHEKEEEKRHEKSWEEKWRRDPVSAVVWALILIWAGLVFLAANLGWLPRLVPVPEGLETLGAWPLILLGAGGIVLLGVAVRLLVPIYRRPIGGEIILAVVFLAIGASAWIGSEIIWPAALIAVGIAVLLSGLLRRRR